MPELVLLTHTTEFERPTNTGRLVLASAQALAGHDQQTCPWQVRAVRWQRREPEPRLLRDLQTAVDDPSRPYVLLLPASDALIVDVDQHYCPSAASQPLPAGFILLDATWQQAQKMYNQSPYLHALPKWQIQSAQTSVYALRRNQKQQGWCTAELVQLLWRYSGAVQSADLLSQRFADFNRR